MKKKLTIFKKTTSIRKIQKVRKQVFLGLDDVKKKLYVWDFVELKIPMEVKSSWISRIYWNPVDGAFVDSHPAHKALGLGNGYRDLRSFLGEKYDISNFFHDNDGKYIPNTSIKKVSYQDYLDWKKDRKQKEDEKENNSNE